MSTEATEAALSAILFTPGRFDRLARTIAALQSQTIHDRIELILVAGKEAGPPPDEGMLAGFCSHQVVWLEMAEITGPEALAAGVAAAQTPIVVFCEDHSYPEPSWAERLLAAHQGPWAVVAPAMRNGNPGSLVSWADFFIGYGEWVYPGQSGEYQHLPGHNSSYKRDILLAYGDQLAHKLEAETLLHWELHRQGHKLYQQADAVTRHINFTMWRKILVGNWWQGRHFGGLRTASWPWRRRLPWIFASPLIPVVRLLRTMRAIRKPGRFEGSLLELLPLLCLFLLSDGIGQIAGGIFGPGDAYQRASHYELFGEARANKPAS